MNKGLPWVSVIVPCRNEADWIRPCLESIINNDYPNDALEIIVVDGMSDDGTRATIESFAARYPFIRLLDNLGKTAPAALNVGIAAAQGEVIMRMDAHNEYPTDYISKLVYWLDKSGADNVGGLWITRPGNNTATAKAIAVGGSHPFGVGNARYRTGASEPCEVDTVPFGCYRRDVFDRIGLFDEELVRNQDNEFNQRLRNAGGTILLIPEVASYYYARATLGKLWRMYYDYGYFNALVVRKIGGRIGVRHWIPSLFVLALFASGVLSPWFTCSMAWLFACVLTAYAVSLVAFSLFASVRHGIRIGLLLPLVFGVLHFGKGIGFLKGGFDFWLFRKRIPTSDATEIRMTR